MKFAWFSFKNEIGLIYKKGEFAGGEKEEQVRKNVLNALENL